MEAGDDDQTANKANEPNDTLAAEEEHGSCPVRASIWMAAKILNFSYLIPAALCLIIGAAASFRWALVASSAASIITLLVSYTLFKCTSPDSQFNPKVFPKLFEVFNPIFFAVLTPVGWWQGCVSLHLSRRVIIPFPLTLTVPNRSQRRVLQTVGRDLQHWSADRRRLDIHPDSTAVAV